MKMLYRGYVYEAIDPAMEEKLASYMSGNNRISQNDLMALLDYVSKRDKETNKTNDEYYDVEEEVEKNQELDVPSILKKWNIDFKEVDGDYVYQENGDYYIVRGREVVDVNRLIERPEQYPIFKEYITLADSINNEFWRFPEPLYHATDCENMESILKNGLHTSAGSGLSNMNSRGVFTSTEVDGYIDSYGDCKVMIDAPAMKRDGNTFYVEREPEIFDYILSNAISSKYDIDVTREVTSSGGMDPNTWIVGGDIPPKYITKVEN